MSSVAGRRAVIERIRIGRQGTKRPHATDEVKTAHDFRGRESPRFYDVWIIRSVVRRIARTAKSGMVVIDPTVEHGDTYTASIMVGCLHSGRTDIRHRLAQIHFVVADPMDR